MKETRRMAFTKDEILNNVSIVVRPLNVEYNGISKSYKGWVNKWLVVKQEDGVGFLSKEPLEFFGIDEETLWKLAESHAKADFEISDFMGDGTMFIGTCQNRIEGAYNALVNIDKAFETLKTNKIWVLPSSIHEVIFIADRDGVTKDGLSEMICHVNETSVSPDEVLGTTPLYFEL